MRPGGTVKVPFGQAMVTRIVPLMEARDYTTFGMSRPLRTHWRKATCAEADCAAYRLGWSTTVDLSTELGRKQFDLITHDRERTYTEERLSLTLVRFTYGPGFPCFRRGEHRVRTGVPPRLYVAHGDWRGFAGTPRVHRYAEDWAEEFSEHQDRLATAFQRG